MELENVKTTAKPKWQNLKRKYKINAQSKKKKEKKLKSSQLESSS